MQQSRAAGPVTVAVQALCSAAGSVLSWESCLCEDLGMISTMIKRDLVLFKQEGDGCSEVKHF